MKNISGVCLLVLSVACFVLGAFGGVVYEIYVIATAIFDIVKMINGDELTFAAIFWLVLLWFIRSFVTLLIAIVAYFVGVLFWVLGMEMIE